MRCKMKAMIMDMGILSHKTQCFLMFGHVGGVGGGKRRGLPAILDSMDQCIALMSNLTPKPVFLQTHLGVSCRCSLKSIVVWMDHYYAKEY